jgi:CheY-like chemotaxis protein
MDGPTATRAIRALGYTGRIFGVTGNGVAADVERFLASGIDRVILKPFSLPDFQAALVCGPVWSDGKVSPRSDPINDRQSSDEVQNDNEGCRDSSRSSELTLQATCHSISCSNSNSNSNNTSNNTSTHNSPDSSGKQLVGMHTVLVVEDNTMNRKMLVKLFNSVGRSVEEARNGQVAVDKVKQRLAEGRPAYDAILMDFTMVSE